MNYNPEEFTTARIWYTKYLKFYSVRITAYVLFTFNIMTIIKVYTNSQKLLPTYWGI